MNEHTSEKNITTIFFFITKNTSTTTVVQQKPTITVQPHWMNGIKVHNVQNHQADVRDVDQSRVLTCRYYIMDLRDVRVECWK